MLLLLSQVEKVFQGVPSDEIPLQDKNFVFGASRVGSVSLFQDINFHTNGSAQSEPVGWSGFLPPPDPPLPGTGVMTEFWGWINNISGTPWWVGGRWGEVALLVPPVQHRSDSDGTSTATLMCPPLLAPGIVPSSSAAPYRLDPTPSLVYCIPPPTCC